MVGAGVSPAAAARQPGAGGGALRPGRPTPLGAQVTPEGVNFAVWAPDAWAIDLCLFDNAQSQEHTRLRLPARTGEVWHGLLPEAGPGLIYGLRAHGPWQPARGQRFDPSKLLLDPWAREVVGDFIWCDAHFSTAVHQPDVLRAHDNAAMALKARVCAQAPYDWGDDRAPQVPWSETVLYEAHVKGLTRLHPDIAPDQRGRLAALGHPALIAHLQRLGVSTLCLLPIARVLDEEHLVAHGLSNYWGYNPLAQFVLDPRLAQSNLAAEALDELRGAVRALHRAGIEVVLDVVFNHSPERGPDGPTLSWRGLGQARWYRSAPGLDNLSGCGNTFDLSQPGVLRWVMDALRFWVQVAHVDGFRFDLASVLGRGVDGAFEARSAFFAALAQDPLLAGLKWIAEPWDLGAGGYQVGAFAPGWAQWNDRFRDTLRLFWLRGTAQAGQPIDGGNRAELATRLAGSADVFAANGHAPWASVNYVVSHDGFTLRDLTSYVQRHNLANAEANRDGTTANHSDNAGVEGETDRADVLQRRALLQRALLACLLLAQGTPMLAAGDELGHTQQGNNNPYCQDNPLTWLDWTRADATRIAYVAHLIDLRRCLLPLGAHWYSGQTDAQAQPDLAWADADGHALSDADWHSAVRSLRVSIAAPGRSPQPLVLLIHAHLQAAAFALPEGLWRPLLDSAQPDGRPLAQQQPTRGPVELAALSVQLWQRQA